MRKRINIFLICIMLVTSCIMVVFPVVNVKSERTTIYVHPGEGIQDAIDSASHGDTVFVYSGIYTESLEPDHEYVRIDKSLTLKGENKANTIINCPGLAGYLPSIY